MSENIFKEIYAKVISLFKQTEQEDNAKDIAKNRLRVVLMQDRTNLTPELLERMRKELVELLSKYVEMDKEALELNLDQEGDQMALMLSIPVIRAKDESEIEKALADAETKTENSEEDSEEENEQETSEEEAADEEKEQETSEDENDAEEKSTKENQEDEETEADTLAQASEREDESEEFEEEEKISEDKK